MSIFRDKKIYLLILLIVACYSEDTDETEEVVLNSISPKEFNKQNPNFFSSLSECLRLSNELQMTGFSYISSTDKVKDQKNKEDFIYKIIATHSFCASTYEFV